MHNRSNIRRADGFNVVWQTRARASIRQITAGLESSRSALALLRVLVCCSLSVAFIPLTPVHGQVVQERVDLDAIARIRKEGLEHSAIPELAHHLTDVIGPRLTGSPGMKAANEWTAATLRSWGLVGVTIEPWGRFGRGWENLMYSGRILTPYNQPLAGQSVAWTGSTRGSMVAPVMVVDGAVDSMARYGSRLRGALVLMSPPQPLLPEFRQSDRRTPADSLLAAVAQRPEVRIGWDTLLVRIRNQQARRDSLLRAAEVAGVIIGSGSPYGNIRGGGDWSATDPSTPTPVPMIVVPQEQYNEMYRNVTSGVPVNVQLDVQNRFINTDLDAYNTLGDIRGSDKRDEYVMIGAHLDSWHYGNGATDNAAGSIVMMEAMRILKSLDLHPRRTIRIALWSGEEEGIYGSRGWITKHPELVPRISAYLNLDNGTGRIRGIWDQSNAKAIPIFEQILWPFRDLGVVAVRHGNTGSTDHVSFDDAGIPGFNFIQDPIEYGLRTHHSSSDVYDHLMLDDLKQAAVVVASTAYELANRDEMVPRK
ncbi:MAG: M20/M25/M40 family metallo-hydrolase [Gemmatimonadota bacterium]|nr:M20/M25/M40 family metallo-hydrolase [Gemmatimonadota bacterium]